MIKRLLLIICLLALPLLAFGASISTLTDNFNDNSIDAAKWDNEMGGQAVETNNELELSSNLIGQDIYFYSQNWYDLTGSQATIKLVDAGNQSLASWQFIFFLTDTGYNHYLYFRINAGTITFKDLAYQTYDPAIHKYLRIREAGGNAYGDYSSDGINWNNLASLANGVFVVTNVKSIFEIINTLELSTTTAKVDDFNILPSATQRRIILIL